MGRAPDHDRHTLAVVGIALALSHRNQLVRDHALAPREPPALSAAAQPFAGLGTKLLLDLVEVDLYFAQGSGGHHARIGYVSHVHYLDPADPPLQQADRGVERPAGGSRPASYPTTRHRFPAGSMVVLMEVKGNPGCPGVASPISGLRNGGPEGRRETGQLAEPGGGYWPSMSRMARALRTALA